MPITELEIIDSAVKIGLGAVISGIVAYTTLKATHNHEKAKESRAHKIKTLEMIAEKCDLYFIAHSRFKGVLGGILKDRPTEDEYPLTEDQLNRLNKSDSDLFAARDGVQIATSRLVLLGANEALKHLTKVVENTADLRNNLRRDKIAPSTADLGKIDETIRNDIGNFRQELSKFYKAL